MASAAYRPELTLTPFRRVYYAFDEVALLADRAFDRVSSELSERSSKKMHAATLQAAPMSSHSEFEATVDRWFADIKYDSLPGDMKDHESFAAIIAGGQRVVPLIAASLRRKPSYLFLALEEITRSDPVPEKAYGDLKATVGAWLQWLQT